MRVNGEASGIDLWTEGVDDVVGEVEFSLQWTISHQHNTPIRLNASVAASFDIDSV